MSIRIFMFTGSTVTRFSVDMIKRSSQGMQAKRHFHIYKQYDSQSRTEHVMVYYVHVYREKERSFSYTKNQCFMRFAVSITMFVFGIEFHGPKRPVFLNQGHARSQNPTPIRPCVLFTGRLRRSRLQYSFLQKARISSFSKQDQWSYGREKPTFDTLQNLLVL